MNHNIVVRHNDTNLRATIREEIVGTALDAANQANATYKETYYRKMALIEGAQDMSTQEKLKAMDQTSDKRSHDIWNNVLTFTIVVGIFAGGSWAVKFCFTECVRK